MKTGDRVFVTFRGKTVVGNVLLASGNEHSLMIAFDGMLGGYVGMVPLLREPPDPDYRDLIMGEPVTVTTDDDHPDR